MNRRDIYFVSRKIIQLDSEPIDSFYIFQLQTKIDQTTIIISQK